MSTSPRTPISSQPTIPPRTPHVPARAPAAREAAVTPSLPHDAVSVGARRTALIGAVLALVPAADRSAAATAVPAILDAACAAHSADPNRLGYLLATAQTESDFGAAMTERGHSRAWFNASYGAEDGNRPGTDDGYTYRGRGYVQTTHAGRYAQLSHRLGLPDVVRVDHGRRATVPALVAQPDRLTEPRLAARALVVGVEENLFTHNARAALDRTIPLGRKAGDADFYHARGIVNGIVAGEAQTIARHATDYARVLAGYASDLQASAVKR